VHRQIALTESSEPGIDRAAIGFSPPGALSSRVASSAARMFSGVSMAGIATPMFSAGPTCVLARERARLA
jgi:hypothetical protein